MKFILFTAYALMSFYFLNKYPTLSVDEVCYTEPALNLLEKGKMSFELVHPFGGFEQVSLIQHSYLLSISRAFIFSFWKLSLKSMRFESYLMGLLAIVLVYFLTKNPWLCGILALSNPFIIASHSARPDMTVTTFILSTLFLAHKEDWLLSGLFALLAAEIHPTGNIALAVLAGFMIYKRSRKELETINWILAILGISIGTIFILTTHFKPLYLEELKIMHQCFAQPGIRPWTEWKRWYDFFWLGAYHRNMIWLILLIPAMIKRSLPNVILALGVIGFMLSPGLRSTQYVIYLWPFILWSITEWAVAVKYPFITYLMIGGLILGELVQVYRFKDADYDKFSQNILAILPKDGKVLGTAVYWPFLRDRLVPEEILMYKGLCEEAKFGIPFYQGDTYEFLNRLGVKWALINTESRVGTIYQHTILKPFLDSHAEFTYRSMHDSFYADSRYQRRRSDREIWTDLFKIK